MTNAADLPPCRLSLVQEAFTLTSEMKLLKQQLSRTSSALEQLQSRLVKWIDLCEFAKFHPSSSTSLKHALSETSTEVVASSGCEDVDPTECGSDPGISPSAMVCDEGDEPRPAAASSAFSLRDPVSSQSIKLIRSSARFFTENDRSRPRSRSRGPFNRTNRSSRKF